MATKQELQKIIDDIKAKKFREGEAKGLMTELQKEQTKALLPVLEEISRQGTERMVAAFEKAIQAININVPDIEIPEIKIPNIYMPEFPRIPAPIVNYTAPEIRIPDIKMPEEMEVKGWINLMGFDRGLLSNPLPVQLRDAKGNPLNLLENLRQIMAGVNPNASSAAVVGGGMGNYFTIKDILNSIAAVITDSSGQGYSGSNPLPVTIASGGNSTSASNIVDSSGVAYTGSNPVPVTVISSAAASTASALVDSSGVQYSGSNPLPITGPVVVTSITNTTAAAVVDSSGAAYSGSNPLPVNIVSQSLASVASAMVDSTGIQYSGSNPVPVVIAAGSNNSVAAALIDSSGVEYNTSNPLPVNLVSQSLASSASALVDSSGIQYSGSNPLPITGPVVVTSITNTTAANIVDSGGVVYSGSNPLPVNLVSQSLASSASALVDSSGIQYSGSNPVPIVIASGSANSVASANVDSSGVQYSGSNPFPVTIISGALTSSIAVGASTIGTADDGSAPVQQGGLGRTTNPTKVTDGQVVKASFDVTGRQLIRPVQVRGLVQTAYVQVSTGTETTLRAGVAAAFLDLIYIKFSNNSDAAVSVDLRQVTTGNVIDTYQVPANGVVGISLPVPYPQQDTGNNWTVDLPDITGTTISVSALFSQEV